MKIEILLEAKALLDEGKALKSIAKELDVKYRTLLANLKAYGFYTPTRKPAIEITPDLTDQIVAKFNQGLTFREIGNDLNISGSAVGNKLIDLGLYTSNDYGWSEEEKVNLQKLYNEGRSSRELAKLYNCSKRRILDALDETREPSTFRIYDINHNAFESITTEEQAYWLGFMYADGNVGTKEHSITMTLTDEQSVLDFRDFLQTDRPLYVNYRSKVNPNWKDAYTLTVHSKKLKDDLIALGCVPNKTDKITELPDIDEALMHHFLRGLFDGDGCISIDSRKKYFHFSYTGYIPFMETVQQKLMEVLDVPELSIYERKPNYGSIATGKRDNIKKLYEYLYKDATVFMERKRTKFEQITIKL